MIIRKVKTENLKAENEFIVTIQTKQMLGIQLDCEEIYSYLTQCLEVVAEKVEDKELFEMFIDEEYPICIEIFKYEIQAILEDLSMAFSEDNNTLEHIKGSFNKLGNNIEKKIFWIIWRRVTSKIEEIFEQYKKAMN